MNRSSHYRPNWRLLVPLLPGLVACGQEAVQAELLLPEEVTVGWERAYNGLDDGLGALVPVDVMVYDGTTGNPLPGVVVAVWTDNVAAWPVSVDEVWLLPADLLSEEAPSDPEPTDPAGPEPEGSEPAGPELEGSKLEGTELEEPDPQSTESASAPADAEIDPPGQVRAWDATRDQFVAFDPVDGIELITDEGGVARLYVYVDAFPEAPEGGSSEGSAFERIRVLVSMDRGEGDPVLDELVLRTPR